MSRSSPARVRPGGRRELAAAADRVGGPGWGVVAAGGLVGGAGGLVVRPDVGAADGVVVGPEVGAADGVVVGPEVGAADGVVVGPEVGAADGVVVGPDVGMADPAVVGAGGPVGTVEAGSRAEAASDPAGSAPAASGPETKGWRRGRRRVPLVAPFPDPLGAGRGSEALGPGAAGGNGAAAGSPQGEEEGSSLLTRPPPPTMPGHGRLSQPGGASKTCEE